MTLFSIISPVLNAESTIKENIQSVQQDGLAEQIVIDGGSTDGTLEVLKDYSKVNLQYISEPDKGSYDAMNKGIRMAKGDIIGILNADDFYADDRVLQSVAEMFRDPEIDTCYADLEYVDRENTGKVVRRWKAGPYDLRNWYWGWMPPHPTFFVRRSVYEKYGLYRLDMGTSADYELMLRFLLKHGVTTHYIPRVLVKMRTGGLSNASLKSRLTAHRMDHKAWKVNGLKPRPWTLPLKPIRKITQWF